MSTQVPDPRRSDPASDAANAIALPIFAVISSIIMVLPFRAFWRLCNFPSCSLCVTLWILNLGTFLNSIIWNTDDWTTWWMGYGLCDIESLLRWPITLSAATATMCFIKGLATALDTESVNINPTKGQRRRNLIVEILIVWGPPFFIACLHYVVQAGRYAITPVFGCTDELDNSWPYIVLVVIWCPIVSLFSSGYAILLLYRLRKHRMAIASALSTTGSGMVPRKFIKLAFISLIILAIYLPVQILFIFRSIPTVLVKFDWDRIHNPRYWNAISLYHTSDVPLLQYSGWATISYGFLLLPFYGFTTDAIRSYRKWLVTFGFGKLFPSLREPYIPNGRGGSSFGSGGSRNSWVDRFDVVSRISKYFGVEHDDQHAYQDNRNISVGSTTCADNSTIGGRTVSVSTSPVSIEKGRNTTPISDIITPRHNRFSTIRWFNPFAIFTRSSKSPSSHTSSTHSNHTVMSARQPFSIPSSTDRDLEANIVTTNIWSPSQLAIAEDQDSIDPLSPVLGSRAYRERERREMEKAESKKLAKAKKESVSGVVVKTQLDIKVEGRDRSGSQL